MNQCSEWVRHLHPTPCPCTNTAVPTANDPRQMPVKNKEHETQSENKQGRGDVRTMEEEDTRDRSVSYQCLPQILSKPSKRG